MNSNGLSRLYDRLEPEERLRLVLQAIIRNDHEEVERLWESCPRETYTMVDTNFLELYDQSLWVAASFAILWLDANRRVTSAKLAKNLFQLALMAFDRGFDVGLQAAKRIPNEDHPIWPASDEGLRHYDTLREEAERWYREAVARLKGVYAGFLRFCRAAGVEPEELLALCGEGLRAEIAETRGLLECDIPADEETANATYRRLCEEWPDLDPVV